MFMSLNKYPVSRLHRCMVETLHTAFTMAGNVVSLRQIYTSLLIDYCLHLFESHRVLQLGINLFTDFR
jgi:hypothetical protein